MSLIYPRIAFFSIRVFLRVSRKVHTNVDSTDQHCAGALPPAKLYLCIHLTSLCCISTACGRRLVSRARAEVTVSVRVVFPRTIGHNINNSAAAETLENKFRFKRRQTSKPKRQHPRRYNVQTI